MKREPGGFTHRIRIVEITGRQGKHLPALMRTHRDAVGDGVALELGHRLVIPGEIAVL
ncbi:hypothetical protein ACFL1S_03465 [Pseudomonadota bacterium]